MRRQARSTPIPTISAPADLRTARQPPTPTKSSPSDLSPAKLVAISRPATRGVLDRGLLISDAQSVGAPVDLGGDLSRHDTRGPRVSINSFVGAEVVSVSKP